MAGSGESCANGVTGCALGAEMLNMAAIASAM
jgi:hypothetical protein